RERADGAGRVVCVDFLDHAVILRNMVEWTLRRAMAASSPAVCRRRWMSAHAFGGVGTGRGRENDGPVAVEEDAAVDMRVDGAGQNLALHVAAKAYIVLGALGVCDAHRVLLDDRAFVEVGRHIVRGRAD